MSSHETTNLCDNITNVPINNTTSTTSIEKGTSLTKREIDGEDSETNLFLSDESSGNDQMDEASGETSGETSNGSNSSNSKKSNSSISTMEAWFREFNQNTKELNKNNFDDDDSETPYYVNSYKTHPKHPKHPKLVPNQQPSIISRHQHSQRTGHHARIPSVSNHGNFHNKCEESSGSDSYRSVIDDLTLKNQKLRQKLRKLERIHSKSLHKEKLFEVRYYQMPRKKRHELEEYLRQFAAQLSTPNSSSTQNSTNLNDSTENSITPNTLNIKASDKSKMKQVVWAIENVFTTKPSLDDHYLKDQEDADPQGYVYLNLLTNMAQLHTMSVTLPFVKQAIRTFSNCLELNDDGTKVRWRTGLDHIKPDQFSLSGGSTESLSRNGGISEISSSSAGDKQSDSSPSNPSIQNYSSDQKNPLNAYITPSLTSSNTNNRQIKSTPQITHYRPVFLHRNVSSSSLSSGETSSENDQHDGPVIYYEGGLFCTDFSRDMIIDDEDKPVTSSGTQSSPALDNSIEDDNNIDIFKERWNLPHYERATNSILGGNNTILNEINEISDNGQEIDESSTKLCDICGPNDHCSSSCSHIFVDNPMIIIDDRHKENSTGINDELNKILLEKDIEFNSQSEKHYGEINDWNNHVSSSSPSTNNNSNQCMPDYKRLHTTKVPGIITEDNFMLLVQTSHPPEKRLSRFKESSVDNEINLSSSSNSSNSSMDMGQQNNERSQQSPKSHKVLSAKLFQLPPSMSPQPRTSPPPGVRRTSFATRSKTSSSDSGGSSGYGSSSSSYSNNFSEPSSTETSRVNTYLLRNNTLLQLSQSNNANLKCSQYDEIQDMELDSLSSDSSDPSPFINIDADEDEVIEVKDSENNKRRKNRVEESVLGMNLRLQDAAIEERRKLADKAAPQEQRTMYLKNIVASSRAMIEALEDNKNNSNVIDSGMDALPTAPLPFFNQRSFPDRNAQSSSSLNLGVNNDNYNNDIDL